MLVAQVIPSVVRNAVQQAQLVNLARTIIDRNQDIRTVRDNLITQGTAKDQAALQAVQRNPDIAQLIKDESFNIV
jgi:hypothetical protein